jgi:hypothetical protein
MNGSLIQIRFNVLSLYEQSLQCEPGFPEAARFQCSLPLHGSHKRNMTPLSTSSILKLGLSLSLSPKDCAFMVLSAG